MTYVFGSPVVLSQVVVGASPKYVVTEITRKQADRIRALAALVADEHLNFIDVDFLEIIWSRFDISRVGVADSQCDETLALIRDGGIRFSKSSVRIFSESFQLFLDATSYVARSSVFFLADLDIDADGGYPMLLDC